MEVAGQDEEPALLLPFSPLAERYSLGDWHYIAEGNLNFSRVPLPFAQAHHVPSRTPVAEQEPLQYSSSGPFRSLGNYRTTGVLGITYVTATSPEFGPHADFMSFAFY